MHTLPFQKHLLYLGAILIRYSFFKDLAELRLRIFVGIGSYIAKSAGGGQAGMRVADV
jgi:hypothetical protein